MGAGEPAVPWLQVVTTLLERSETKSLSLSKVCVLLFSHDCGTAILPSSSHSVDLFLIANPLTCSPCHAGAFASGEAREEAGDQENQQG